MSEALAIGMGDRKATARKLVRRLAMAILLSGVVLFEGGWAQAQAQTGLQAASRIVLTAQVSIVSEAGGSGASRQQISSFTDTVPDDENINANIFEILHRTAASSLTALATQGVTEAHADIVVLAYQVTGGQGRGVEQWTPLVILLHVTDMAPDETGKIQMHSGLKTYPYPVSNAAPSF